LSETVEKIRRRRLIRELVERRKIATQEALREALASRGHPATQATLSRDLRDLGIARVPTARGYRYVAAERGAAGGARDPSSVRSAPDVRSVECNEAAVVVRTLVGRAQGVAVELDGLALEPVLGTVAGDDTIVVIPRSTRKTRSLRRQLARLWGIE
jgi:transcriptional regulator of arginine metabolism